MSLKSKEKLYKLRHEEFKSKRIQDALHRSLLGMTEWEFNKLITTLIRYNAESEPETEQNDNDNPPQSKRRRNSNSKPRNNLSRADTKSTKSSEKQESRACYTPATKASSTVPESRESRPMTEESEFSHLISDNSEPFEITDEDGNTTVSEDERSVRRRLQKRLQSPTSASSRETMGAELTLKPNNLDRNGNFKNQMAALEKNTSQSEILQDTAQNLGIYHLQHKKHKPENQMSGNQSRKENAANGKGILFPKEYAFQKFLNSSEPTSEASRENVFDEVTSKIVATSRAKTDKSQESPATVAKRVVFAENARDNKGNAEKQSMGSLKTGESSTTTTAIKSGILKGPLKWVSEGRKQSKEFIEALRYKDKILNSLLKEKTRASRENVNNKKKAGNTVAGNIYTPEIIKDQPTPINRGLLGIEIGEFDNSCAFFFRGNDGVLNPHWKS